MEHQGDQTVTQIQDGDRSKEEIPEPEDQVNLLVDNVLCEDTHAVVYLQVDIKHQEGIDIDVDINSPEQLQKLQHLEYHNW